MVTYRRPSGAVAEELFKEPSFDFLVCLFVLPKLERTLIEFIGIPLNPKFLYIRIFFNYDSQN